MSCKALTHRAAISSAKLFTDITSAKRQFVATQVAPGRVCWLLSLLLSAWQSEQQRKTLLGYCFANVRAPAWFADFVIMQWFDAASVIKISLSCILEGRYRPPWLSLFCSPVPLCSLPVSLLRED